MFIHKPVNPKYLKRRKILYGIGVNDADYVTAYISETGTLVACHFYETWRGMLERAYSSAFHERSPSYKGCTVSPEWHNFSAFKTWMELQDWEGKALDKDILFQGNKEYSPEKCLFVSQEINSLTVMRGNARGTLPLGVSLSKQNKYSYYTARLSMYGKQKTLGSFKSIEEASICYQEAKKKYIEEVAARQSDQRLKAALLKLTFQ